jgi:uncharacterized coiled-coil DUF342 family protein
LSTEYTIQEVEHENLILAQELISLYKDRISTLEAKIKELQAQLTTVPLPVTPTPQRQRIATITDLRELLEKRSSKVVGEPHEA